jgi:hypothetical protein
MNPQYAELTQIMPVKTIIEDLFAVREGIREASLAPLAEVSLKADKMVDEVVEDLSKTYLIPLQTLLEEGKGEEKVQEYLEAKKSALQKVCEEISEIAPEILSRRAFHSYVEKLGLSYIIDVGPHIGHTPEGCGITLYSLQDFLSQINRLTDEEKSRAIAHASMYNFPAIKLIFFDRGKEKEIKEKYEEFLEVRKKKLDSIEGIFATKDSINYSSLETAILGTMLGYPPCCTGFYTELKRRTRLNEIQKSSKHYIPPESYVAYQGWLFGINELLAEKLLKDEFNSRKIVDFAESEMHAEFYSKPFDSFYPCSVRCFNAIKIGEQIEEQLKKIDPKFVTSYKISLVGRFLLPLIIDLKSKIPFENLFPSIKKVKSYSGLKFFEKFKEYSDLHLISLKPFNRIENYITLLQYYFFSGKDMKELDALPEISSTYERIYSSS